MTTILIPDADDLGGGWTNESGNTQLFGSVNETSANDATYIQSSDLPGSGDVMRLRLANPGGIVVQPVKVRYRIRKDQSSDQVTSVIVRLKENGVEKASWVESGIPDAFTTFNRTLTQVQFDSIGDFNNLYLEFEAKSDVLWVPETALGELVWFYWAQEDLSSGAVSSWTDRVGGLAAVQSTPVNQPTKSVGEVTFNSNSFLTFGSQPEAYKFSRVVALLFKADISSAETEEGSFFAINGFSTSAGARQPILSYLKSTNQVESNWIRGRDGFGSYLASVIPDTDWHVLISRRADGVHYWSIDGGPESSDLTDLVIMRHNLDLSGFIGDYRIPNNGFGGPNWSIDSLIVIQGESTNEMREALAAWALWKKGRQSLLPTDSPYKNAAPIITPQNSYTSILSEQTAGEWTSFEEWWADDADISSDKEQGLGQPNDLTGYTLVFEDHFTSNTVAHENEFNADWFSPVHNAATGAAATADPSDATVFGQSGSELTITMHNPGSGWKSGVFSSINHNGYGNTWKYPVYFEMRARFTLGNGFGAWPAFWLKSANEFLRLTETRVEIDVVEAFASDPLGYHNAHHNWPADRNVLPRITEHRFVGNYLNGRTMFDNNYHTYGCRIEEDFTYIYHDNFEIMRYPTPPENLRDLFILVDLAMLPDELASASGSYVMGIDYIRVYKQT